MGKEITLMLFKKEELKEINWVRMHLQVKFISDLISDSSMIINQNFRVGSSYKCKIRTSQWPEYNPPTRDRSTWVKFINILTHTRGMILHSMGLNYRDISEIGRIRHELVSNLFHLPNE